MGMGMGVGMGMGMGMNMAMGMGMGVGGGLGIPDVMKPLEKSFSGFGPTAAPLAPSMSHYMHNGNMPMSMASSFVSPPPMHMSSAGLSGLSLSSAGSLPLGTSGLSLASSNSMVGAMA